MSAVRDENGLRQRVAAADSFVHLQDLPETDLLLASDYAAHEAGFAAAQAITGGKAALYHLDSTRPDRPRARALPEEIARVVLGRATQRGWLEGMMRHGFRGAAEIAATLDHMAAFAHLAGVVEPHLFDLYHDATLGDAAVAAIPLNALQTPARIRQCRISLQPWMPPACGTRGEIRFVPHWRRRNDPRQGMVPRGLYPDDVRRRSDRTRTAQNGTAERSAGARDLCRGRAFWQWSD